MNREDLSKYDVDYEKECPTCTMTMNVVTQADNFPEYLTDIYIRCHCGEYIHFSLPVN